MGKHKLTERLERSEEVARHLHDHLLQAENVGLVPIAKVRRIDGQRFGEGGQVISAAL